MVFGLVSSDDGKKEYQILSNQLIQNCSTDWAYGPVFSQPVTIFLDPFFWKVYSRSFSFTIAFIQIIDLQYALEAHVGRVHALFEILIQSHGPSSYVSKLQILAGSH